MASFLLACPLCSQPGFQCLDSLRDGLINAATRHVICPVCQDALPGLDKFTLHLFSHSLQQQFPSSQARRPEVPVDTADGATQTDETLDNFTFCGSLFDGAREENTAVEGMVQARAVEDNPNLQIVLQHESVCFDKNFKKLAPPIQCTVDFTIESDFTSAVSSEVVSCTNDAKLGMDTNLTGNVSGDNGNCSISSGVVEAKSCIDHDKSSASEHVNGPSRGAARCNETGLRNALFEDPEFTDVQEQLPSRCSLCGFNFPEKQILVMHQQLVHPECDAPKSQPDDKRQHACHLCSKSFKMRGSLMVHLRVAHSGNSLGKGLAHKVDPGVSTEDKKFVCPACMKMFKKEHHLTQHVKTHEGKQWECDVCFKLFTTKYFLKKHKRLHTGEMPYACGTCGKTFTFQQSYHKHLLYHSDEKPHVCQHCERAFKELSTLHNHQRIHTGEKPFACETCGTPSFTHFLHVAHRRLSPRWTRGREP